MKEKISEKEEFGLNIEEMAEVGLHFGHKSSKAHPKMEPYLFGVRNSIHIIDLRKTKEKFKEALKFIKELVVENKILLVVGTRIHVKDLVNQFALDCGFPYINERWPGGVFTNFEVIKKRINYFKDLKEKKDKGELEKYTKKEQIKIDRELKSFERKFGGIKYLDKLPEAVLILDMDKDELAIKEAREKGIKIIAISDSNTNPKLADYPIPANDNAKSSVQYILEKIKQVVLKTKGEQPKDKQYKEEKDDNN